jgi:hypothetical protein
MYYFMRGMFVRDDHPMALYTGSKRLSPPPTVVWWFPSNWLVVPILLAAVVAKSGLLKIKSKF